MLFQGLGTVNAAFGADRNLALRSVRYLSSCVPQGGQSASFAALRSVLPHNLNSLLPHHVSIQGSATPELCATKSKSTILHECVGLNKGVRSFCSSLISAVYCYPVNLWERSGGTFQHFRFSSFSFNFEDNCPRVL